MATSNLSVYIRAFWDPQAFEQMQRQLESTNWYTNFVARARDNRPASSSDAENLQRAEEDRQLSKETSAGARAKAMLLYGLTGESSGEMDEETERQTKLLQAGQNMTQAGIKGLTSITQGSMDFLEMIYNQLKSASPLLQTIESLFNLAVQLFFMPLGNKLAEVMLPAVLDLVDNVVEMWDAMEGMSISEMIMIAAFYAMQYTMQLMAMYANAVGDSLVGTFGGALAVATLAGVVTGGMAYGVMTHYGMASGGYVPATDGGQWRLLGEGGQGEYVIPENQMNSFGGTTNYYYFNGFTSDDVIRIIRDEVSTQISQSRIRGGF